MSRDPKAPKSSTRTPAPGVPAALSPSPHARPPFSVTDTQQSLQGSGKTHLLGACRSCTCQGLLGLLFWGRRLLRVLAPGFGFCRVTKRLAKLHLEGIRAVIEHMFCSLCGSCWVTSLCYNPDGMETVLEQLFTHLGFKELHIQSPRQSSEQTLTEPQDGLGWKRP